LINLKESEECKRFHAKEVEKIEKLLLKEFTKRKPISLYEPCSYALQGGGKRIRPFLVLITALAAGSNIRKFYNAALSVELLHTFTLVHDDIMDNSVKRRGKPTLHKKYNISTAILAGDNLVATAYELLLRDCCEFSKNVVSTFTNGIIEVCEGQSLDKEFEERSNVSIDEYKLMIYKKTAALAKMCCSIGSQLAGADRKIVAAAENYGKYLGMAFQIQDDLLDIIGDEASFGKKIGSDLVEGKKTYLFLNAIQKASGKDRKELMLVIKNNGISKSKVDKYKKIYKRLGVIDDAKNEIVRYTDMAIKNLKKLPNPKGKLLMEWLAYSLIGRNK